MATKAGKKVSTTSVTSSQSSIISTPATSSTPSLNNRPQSPMSPARLSRLQEKEELQHLNDRLATYIDHIRHLENENSRLMQQVQTSEETVTREVNSIKALYEDELSEARRLLDEMAKEKAKIHMDASKLKQENEDLTNRLSKKEKDLAAAEKNSSYYESKTHDLQVRLNQALAEKKRLEEALKEVKAELEALSKLYNSTKLDLEAEILKRVDFENRLQTSKEESIFKQQLHEKELTETRVRKQVEITEIDGQLQERYEQKLLESLQELRDQYENQMRANREEIENLFDEKIVELKQLNEQYLRNANNARDELSQTKSRLSSLSSRINELEAQNSGAIGRIKDLENLLEEERNMHMAALMAKEDLIRRLQDEIAEQLKDYQDLMGIKVALDVEIAAYRKLLEGEEARLNITPSARAVSKDLGRSTPTRYTPVGTRGLKRRRGYLSQIDESSTTTYNSTANAIGDVEIKEQDVEGKFVRLFNKGETDINIGGWVLTRKLGENAINYKFHRSIYLKAGATISVWSSDAGVTHSPPADLVMKSQSWGTGASMVTRLVNNDGEEVASRDTFRQVLSASTSRVTEGHAPGGVGEVGREDLYHQQGDPENREKCAIM